MKSEKEKLEILKLRENEISLPYGLNNYGGEIVIVDQYKQDLLEGFLVLNLSKEDYTNAEILIREQASIINLNGISEYFYAYAYCHYRNMMDKIKSILDKENNRHLLIDFNKKYKVNKLIIKLIRD